jgi:cytochrome c oxidase assembly protein subunit 15
MTKDASTKIVANWVFIGVAMLIVQVLLGGITRLTGSGLSITEWKPIMGALPPLNETEWQRAFEGYQKIAQYKYINNHFTVSDFKFIFFWEWFHRLWARLISVVFLIPFIYFLTKKYIQKWMITPLLILFLLGGLQGLIGWIMVRSGLNDENLYVNHIRLAIHFIAAMVLICYALIFGLMLKKNDDERFVAKGLRQFTCWIITLITVQLMYGALMAGLKGAVAAPTWPDINGMLIPKEIFSTTLSNDLFFNIINIHFIHRTLAYVIFVLTIIWWLKAAKTKASTSFVSYRKWPLIFVLMQIVLGIAAILNSTKIVLGHFGIFEWIALIHQLNGMLLLLSFVANFYLMKASSER